MKLLKFTKENMEINRKRNKIMELKEEYENLSLDELRDLIKEYFQIIEQDDIKQIHITNGTTLSEWQTEMDLMMKQEFNLMYNK